MSLHNEIKAHAKLVAKDVKAGKASAHSRRTRDFMDDAPDAVLGVIDLVHRAANRKKPNEAMIQAYIYMFATGLEEFAIRSSEDKIGRRSLSMPSGNCWFCWRKVASSRLTCSCSCSTGSSRRSSLRETI